MYCFINFGRWAFVGSFFRLFSHTPVHSRLFGWLKATKTEKEMESFARMCVYGLLQRETHHISSKFGLLRDSIRTRSVRHKNRVIHFLFNSEIPHENLFFERTRVHDRHPRPEIDILGVKIAKNDIRMLANNLRLALRTGDYQKISQTKEPWVIQQMIAKKSTFCCTTPNGKP